jgi:subfamily B ATP-binding cassette protein MsbA
MLRFFGRYLRRYLGWIAILVLFSIPVYAAASTALVALIEPIFGELLQAGPADRGAMGTLAGGGAEKEGDETPGSLSKLNLKDRLDRGYRRLKDNFGIDDQAVVWFIPVLFVVVFLIRAVTGLANGYAFQRIGLGVTNDIRNDLHSRILGQSSAFHAAHSSGELVSRVVSDVTLIQTAITGRLLDLFQQSVTLVLLVVLLLSTQFRLALICLIGLPPIIFVIGRFGELMRRRSLRAQQRMADLTALLSESIRGAHVVKAFGTERFEEERFRRATRRYLRVSLRAQLLNLASSPVVESIMTVGAAGLLFYAGKQVRAGELTAPVLAQFIGNLMLLYEPIRKLNKVNLVVQQARVGAKRTREILEAVNEVQERPGAVTVDGIHEGLRFENVQFSYSDTPVLQGVDLEIRRGEIVALVGPSGAGKTTLVNLLPRFFDPTGGRVLIDGADLRDLTLGSLRAQIGIVTQETVLFDDTIRNNIAYGRADEPLEHVREAARAAYADDFVMAMPDGYDTRIGELGSQLSGGQRQRLSIARAILKDAPILILDEATSHLDSESESLVQEALKNLMADRTTLVIAHRLATAMQADRIVVMDQGRIVESGTHAELLERGGLYRKLYDLQFQDP